MAMAMVMAMATEGYTLMWFNTLPNPSFYHSSIVVVVVVVVPAWEHGCHGAQGGSVVAPRLSPPLISDPSPVIMDWLCSDEADEPAMLKRKSINPDGESIINVLMRSLRGQVATTPMRRKTPPSEGYVYLVFGSQS